MTVTLHFHGAAGTVTGSCYRVVHPNGQFLVDCGLFQGNKTVRALNQKPLPFDAGKIDFVLLTHAHIDHAGLLPKLYHHGYRGPMFMTAPTAGLLEYLLPDSAGIQESDAEHDAKRLSQRGDEPVPPLYTMEDAEEALRHRNNVDYRQWIEPVAVERSQELRHDFGVLIKDKEINPQLVFLDSPLASKVTAVYRKYASIFAETELTADELFNDPRFRIVEAVEDSKAINSIRGGAI